MAEKVFFTSYARLDNDDEALADNGRTQRELDLAADSRFPEVFRAR